MSAALQFVSYKLREARALGVGWLALALLILAPLGVAMATAVHFGPVDAAYRLSLWHDGLRAVLALIVPLLTVRLCASDLEAGRGVYWFTRPVARGSWLGGLFVATVFAVAGLVMAFATGGMLAAPSSLVLVSLPAHLSSGALLVAMSLTVAVVVRGSFSALLLSYGLVLCALAKGSGLVAAERLGFATGLLEVLTAPAVDLSRCEPELFGPASVVFVVIYLIGYLGVSWLALVVTQRP